MPNSPDPAGIFIGAPAPVSRDCRYSRPLPSAPKNRTETPSGLGRPVPYAQFTASQSHMLKIFVFALQPPVFQAYTPLIALRFIPSAPQETSMAKSASP